MPRLLRSLLLKAKAIDPLLPRLLPTCRDLVSAGNELRWLREHVQGVTGRKQSVVNSQNLLRRLCEQRGRGEPLQYILGSEYFGDLEIQCRTGVLIPRQETAASVVHLAQFMRNEMRYELQKVSRNGCRSGPLQVLDLCSGTGCMSLLLAHELIKHGSLPAHSHFTGIDISESAVKLAELNKNRLFPNERCFNINFAAADIFSGQTMESKLLNSVNPHGCTILMANPPYISPAGFARTTQRSVRNFEPKLALVPPISSCTEVEAGDTFYPRILEIARVLRPQCLLVEVADMDQAIRVVRMADKLEYKRDATEIWRDDPSSHDIKPLPNTNWLVRGRGNGRSVFFSNLIES